MWPESLAAVGKGDPDSLLHRSLTAIASFLYRNADHIVVVSPALRNYLIQRLHIAPGRISVVENGVEPDLFTPAAKGDSSIDVSLSIRTELGAAGKFIVSYIGTMGNAHGLQTMVEAAEKLQKLAPQVLFLLVGEGAEKEQLASLVRSRRVTNLRFLGQQSREKIPAYICASDVCLVLLRKAEIFKTVIPSKMLEFMSCARPVILGVEGQARKILEEARAGVCIEPENSDQLAEAILRLAADAQLGKTLGRNGRRHILQYFSRRQTSAAYLALLHSLSGKEKARAKAA